MSCQCFLVGNAETHFEICHTVSPEGDFASQEGTFGDLLRHFWLPQLEGAGGTTGIKWVEATDAANILQCTGHTQDRKLP